jgi:hypothetical protein
LEIAKPGSSSGFADSGVLLPAGLAAPPGTAATAAATTVRASSATAAETSTAATLGFGAGFINIQRPAVELRSVERGDRLIRFGGIRHFDEGETTGAAGVAVGYQVDALHTSVRLEERSDGRFGCGKIQIAYKNILHTLSFCF